MKKLPLLIALLGLAGCAWLGIEAAGPDAASAFLERYDREHREYMQEYAAAAWVQATHITTDTQFLASRAAERRIGHLMSRAREARRFDGQHLPAQSSRALSLLRRSADAPTEPAQLRELTRLESRLEAAYGAGRYCPPGGESCLTLQQLETIIETSRDPAELQEAWLGWRTISPPMKADYSRFVELLNIGATELGYADAGALWRDGYDMDPLEFAAEVERLWNQVYPVYEALHCYVRARLRRYYGELVPADGPIPAHLLGNMWAQQWAGIYALVEPYPGVPGVDTTAALKAQNYSPELMVRQAESFYRSIGFPALPDSFYERSMLTRPAGREVVCHASAWTLDMDTDVRIKMCIEPNDEMLNTIYHELGHIYYDLAYNRQPIIFQGGANDGFHEAIGDTMTLAMTPGYLHQAGLLDTAASDQRATINQQMQMALEKVAFLPFGKLVDQWRWQVFDGTTPPASYTADWWSLKLKYQGIAPPVTRDESVFDPGAKYHIPGNTPYMRYFLAHILQFQFYRSLCEAAGHDGPLHECSFVDSRPAGEKLWAMLTLGQSQPWFEAMEHLTGSRRMDGEALLEYFEPLRDWLAQQNQGQSCGW